METKQKKGPGSGVDGGQELVKRDLCSLDLATGHPRRLLPESLVPSHGVGFPHVAAP